MVEVKSNYRWQKLSQKAFKLKQTMILQTPAPTGSSWMSSTWTGVLARTAESATTSIAAGAGTAFATATAMPSSSSSRGDVMKSWNEKQTVSALIDTQLFEGGGEGARGFWQSLFRGVFVGCENIYKSPLFSCSIAFLLKSLFQANPPSSVCKQ